MWEREKRPLLLVLAIALLSVAVCAAASATAGPRKRTLFVFGDSYADTGNLARDFSPAWGEPYGITFPQRPAGRFSDGRILTDYVASLLGLKSPIPHKWRKVGKRLVPYGMNFAIAGTGVFDTMIVTFNLSVQIDTLAGEINGGTYSKDDIESSTALVSVAGNDYMYYQDLGGTMEGLKDFIPKVVNQLKADIKRLLDLGVPRVAVTNLHPIGCTPYILDYSTSRKECNDSVNQAVAFHNDLLDAAAKELNGFGAGGGDAVVVIDLFDAFMYVIKNERSKFPNVLQQCCLALSSDTRCGYVDTNGTKGYSLCEDRGASFYWDSVHPTQAGWSAVFSWLRSSLSSLLK